MKIIKNGRRYTFYINIKNNEVIVATLSPWLIGYGKYTLDVYYYGIGERSVDIWKKENETMSEFLKRVEKIVLKKLYILGTSILEDIKNIDDQSKE